MIQGLPPSGYGCRKPNPGCTRFWPSGLSSSSLCPFWAGALRLHNAQNAVRDDWARYVDSPVLVDMKSVELGGSGARE